jgi:hypothetical protein
MRGNRGARKKIRMILHLPDQLKILLASVAGKKINGEIGPLFHCEVKFSFVAEFSFL